MLHNCKSLHDCSLGRSTAAVKRVICRQAASSQQLQIVVSHNLLSCSVACVTYTPLVAQPVPAHKLLPAEFEWGQFLHCPQAAASRV